MMMFNTDLCEVWKKEKVPGGGEQYGETLKVNALGTTSFFTSKKDNSISLAKITEAKMQFVDRNFESAIEVCNTALKFGELETICISNAYFIRSECFFMLKKYGKCVKDIDLTSKAQFGEGLFPELNERRNKCMKYIEKASTPAKLKLSFDPDKNYPDMAKVVRIRESKMFGLHVVAKRDIVV